MAEQAAAKSGDVPSPKEAKKSGLVVVLGLVFPALLAFGGGFGGAKIAGASPHATAKPAEPEAQPPGATVALDPFMMTLPDEGGHPHAMKLSLAVELKHGAKEDDLKVFVPRIRDAALSYLRALHYEQAADSARLDELRDELKARMTKTGASSLEQVLITDFVMQ